MEWVILTIIATLIFLVFITRSNYKNRPVKEGSNEWETKSLEYIKEAYEEITDTINSKYKRANPTDKSLLTKDLIKVKKLKTEVDRLLQRYSYSNKGRRVEVIGHWKDFLSELWHIHNHYDINVDEYSTESFGPGWSPKAQEAEKRLSEIYKEK